MRIAFAGTPAPAAAILRHLAEGDHEVALVITTPEKPRGRRGTRTPTPVGVTAQELGLPYLPVATINADDVLERLRGEGIGALVVVAFGQILKAPVLDGWPCINVHFSILPAYRGAAPVERALMDGVNQTGVTIMRMDPGLDTGPIASIATTPVDVADDAGAVMDRLCALAGPELDRTLDAIAAGTFTTRPQPEEGATYAAKITAADRVLTLRSADELVNRVRALSPHIGATCRIGGEPFKVWRAVPAEPTGAPEGLQAVDGALVATCADGGAARIEELQPPGKSRMAAGDFLRGWRGGLEFGE